MPSMQIAGLATRHCRLDRQSYTAATSTEFLIPAEQDKHDGTHKIFSIFAMITNQAKNRNHEKLFI
jgi:hypothetical protein